MHQEEIYEKIWAAGTKLWQRASATPIDVAWLWTIDQVRQKSCRSFATVLKLMEEYPNYHFMSSQPKLYSFVKEKATLKCTRENPPRPSQRRTLGAGRRHVG